MILRGNQIVMIRRKYGTNKGKWCIPCGNIEVGEDVRTAVRREIKEETGLDALRGSLKAIPILLYPFQTNCGILLVTPLELLGDNNEKESE